jgi:hypothetical protein
MRCRPENDRICAGAIRYCAGQMSGQISGKRVDVTHTFSMLTSQQIADAFHCPLPLALRWTDALS